MSVRSLLVVTLAAALAGCGGGSSGGAGGGSTPVLSLSTASLTFSATAGAASPASQAVTVSNTDAGTATPWRVGYPRATVSTWTQPFSP